MVKVRPQIGRRYWQALNEADQARIRCRLVAEAQTDPMARAWLAVLDGHHPLRAWLDGDAPFSALPTELPDSPSPRQLISSHLFTDVHPWFNLPMSPESSPMQRGS